MTEEHGIYKLLPDDADLRVEVDTLGFSTTEELPALDEIVGQPRALAALDLGLGIRHPSYNIYVAGLSGMGKKRMIRRALEERVGREPTPPDWIYVNNFDEPDRPWAIDLAPGEGMRLKQAVDDMVAHLADTLPRVLKDDELSREKQRLHQDLQERSREMFKEVESLAGEKGVAVRPSPVGPMLLPVKEGRPMTDEEIDELSSEEQRSIRERQREVAERATAILSRHEELRRKVTLEAQEIERAFAREHIGPLMQEILRRHPHERVQKWLAKMQAHMVDHLDRFQQDREQQPPQLAMMLEPPEQRFHEYRVNVLVDNSPLEGAPVIIEDAPNYKNLFGIIDRQFDSKGRGYTDFTRIKSGSLMRAAGGFIVFNLIDALTEPVVWKELKRMVKSGSLQIQEYEPLGLFSISALKPEPIPLKVKLVVVGSPLVYHLLSLMDEDFSEIFKVKAEFNPEMERDEEAGRIIGRLLQRMRRDNGDLLAFEAEGVAELVRAAARMANDRRKLTTEFSRVADLAREASYWARRDGLDRVGRPHVRKALEGKVYRSDLVAAKIRELVRDGKLRISLDGAITGQVNGLSVVNLGDYAFGRPMRVTASVGVGTGGVINIDRESKLSGRTHDKGVLILEGYLRHKYGARTPLALSASLTMEQSYGVVDGDSASVAELLCMLSALSGLPLRQEIAVTGSVNQWGQVQAVGGANEKIEGFFDVCREAGLTGRQGVVIPAANVDTLVLRSDVLNAMREERFHLWAADHVDDVLPLLAGVEAGDIDDEDSIHGRVLCRLEQLAGLLKEQQVPPVLSGRGWSPEPSPPRDPRPALPGVESEPEED